MPNNSNHFSVKNKILLSFLIVVSSFGFAQNRNKIEIGTIDSITSKVLNEERKIWVHIPRSAQYASGFAKQKYPVVYVLDGDAHFSSIVGIIEQLSEINGNTNCPEMIVVGIPNTNRTRDLTPTHSTIELPFVNKDLSDNSGGGENFALFLEKELMSYIESKYPAAPYKTLIGHSFGGLTVMNILTSHTQLFNAYIAIDPSMWWDHQQFLKETKNKLASKNLSTISLFMAAANTMGENMDIIRVRKDTSAINNHIRSVLELNDFLDHNQKSNLRYQYKYYNNDSHGSVPLIAAYDGLRFIFDFNELQLSMQERINFNAAVFAKIEKHYENISKHLGYQLSVPESVVNNYGYQALSKNNNDLAVYLFKLNVANYPQSPNVYDSLGDYYEANGDKKNAISSYQKTLELDKDFPETKSKLEKLLK